VLGIGGVRALRALGVTAGVFHLTLSTVGPDVQQHAATWALQDAGGSWNARATTKIGFTGTALAYLSVDNNAVNFPASTTLLVHYHLRPI